MLVRDQAGGAERIGVEHGRAIAHRLRGVDEHPAELAATDDAERRARRDVRRARGRRRPGRRFALDAARHFSSALIAPRRLGLACAERLEPARSAASPAASSATANSAALAAPALPIAKVATGMPLGIWTIE